MRIALVWPEGATFPDIVTDCDIEVFNISDAAPNDRIYKMGAGVQRLHPLEFDALLSTGPVHQAGDKPEVEQAIRAHLNRGSDGKAGLSVVPDGKCAGGVEIGVRACPKCGATEDDNCPYAEKS